MKTISSTSRNRPGSICLEGGSHRLNKMADQAVTIIPQYEKTMNNGRSIRLLLHFSAGTISEISDRYGIGFIDLTLAFVEETNRSGGLLYNPISDTHLNSRGSLIVAKEFTRHLSVPNGSLSRLGASRRASIRGAAAKALVH
jgi:hypothetical protein